MVILLWNWETTDMMNNCIRLSSYGPRLSQNGIKSQGRVNISFAQCPQPRADPAAPPQPAS